MNDSPQSRFLKGNFLYFINMSITSLQSCLSYLAKFSSVKLCCIGDLILDRYQEGKLERISPEAPVPVMLALSKKEVLGGAANVASNLAALGAAVTFCGVTGVAKEDRQFSKMLAKQRIKANLVAAPNFVVPVKIRLMAGNQQILRVDHECAQQTLDDSTIFKALKQWEPSIKAAQLVIISDYAKGTLPPKLVQAIIKRCQQLKRPVLIDPKGSDYRKYTGATLLKPNLKEFNEAVQQKLQLHQPDFWERFTPLAQKMLKALKLGGLLVTLSEQGMAYLDASCKAPLKVTSSAKAVFDVSGAGDTVMAALATCLALKAPMAQAMELANAAASIVVEKLGTATVSHAELKQKLLEQLALLSPVISGAEPLNAKAKIFNLAQLQRVIKQFKKERPAVKIGFTNGCFDCLHLGHLHSLKQARGLCDYLIVGLNSDASVAKLKGPSRPLQDQKTRSELLASLSCVDAVVIFNETNATSLVKKLRPDIIAKEGYHLTKTNNKWPEASIVASYGGKVLELTHVKGYATTDWLAKILKKQKLK